MIHFYFYDDSIGTQIADAWYAQRQFEHSQGVPLCDCSVSQGCDFEINPNALNVAFGYQWNAAVLANRKSFDLIFLCNGGEPLEISSPDIKKILEEESNVYLVSNGFLSPRHPMYHKNVWFPHNIQLCNDYWTRHFYRQYFECKEFLTLPRANLIHGINGSNRAHRRYFWEELKRQIPGFPLKDDISISTHRLNDCQWETVEDQAYREMVNHLYGHSSATGEDRYHNQSSLTGLEGKFGSIPPGYFLLPLYFESHCVVYPETSWINHQLCMTEKGLKCFYSRSWPMPISGAETNMMYNTIGFKTAWNLLPTSLQEFDCETDHAKRMQGAIEAIKWLFSNPEVFSLPSSQSMLDQNKSRFLENAKHIDYVGKFGQIIRSFV